MLQIMIYEVFVCWSLHWTLNSCYTYIKLHNQSAFILFVEWFNNWSAIKSHNRTSTFIVQSGSGHTISSQRARVPQFYIETENRNRARFLDLFHTQRHAPLPFMPLSATPRARRPRPQRRRRRNRRATSACSCKRMYYEGGQNFIPPRQFQISHTNVLFIERLYLV